MNQAGRPWDSEPDDAAEDDAPDPWFRPVWADGDEADDTPPGVRPGPLPRTATPARRDAEPLLGPLAAASAALARLDAMAEMASEPVRDGLIARLAYAEAAGRLASQGITTHPVDLALRDTSAWAGATSGRAIAPGGRGVRSRTGSRMRPG